MNAKIIPRGRPLEAHLMAGRDSGLWIRTQDLRQ